MKQYAFCVDSDGCVMDTMTPKHRFCFGPALIEEWHLQTWEKEAQRRWEEINLWHETRGINRFAGIFLFLQEWREKVEYAEDLPVFENWLQKTREYSEKSLEKEIQRTGSRLLSQVLAWSKQVNERIEALPESQKQIFPMAKEALGFLCESADIYIISSANQKAVKQEWERCGIFSYVTDCMTQEKGTKKECLQLVAARGYQKENMLMTGDAIGDLEAAKFGKVAFFPILAGKEEMSWKQGEKEVFPRWLAGTYSNELQKKYELEFYGNLREDGKNED
ncbi:MAG: HAD family hydrolase [Clostridiales bacterium]|nr:HAD family hydrolase [Clostridiales bacterium]